MKNIQSTVIIRDRGQLTIPEKMREVLRWSSTNSVVTLTTTSKNELVIKPYGSKKQVNWAQIWSNIQLSRSFKGKGGNLSNFIISDRENH